MELLTREQRTTLLDNGRRQARVRGTDEEVDFWPVVKLFYPAGAHTWLLTELDAEDPDVAWGLCDLGMGCPEFGTVRLSELASIQGSFGLGIERDLYWTAKGPISAYIDAADAAGHIVQLPATADGKEAAVDLRLDLAAPVLLTALQKALAALNTAPRFDVPCLGCDSYAIAAEAERAIAAARENPIPRAAPADPDRPHTANPPQSPPD
jgi:Protein of unknown function (DUF2958)